MPREPGPKMTLTVQLVLRAMLAEPSREMYGLEIGGEAGLPSGTVHPILARLERFGWARSSWEDTDPATAGRPRRRYYRLTEDGAVLARSALAQANTSTAALRVRTAQSTA